MKFTKIIWDELIYSPRRIFQTFGGFTSGIGIHYAESSITNSKHQSQAKNLIIGQRILPQIFLRAADFRPVEMQDLLPADARFKVLVFTGNSSDPAQLQRVQVAAQNLHRLLSKLGLGQVSSLFEVLTISSATKREIRYNDLPKTLWSHWSKSVS